MMAVLDLVRNISLVALLIKVIKYIKIEDGLKGNFGLT